MPQKTYLTGLTGLRFFAALLVIVYHCNDGLRQLDPLLFQKSPILTRGPLAVEFFFIISGYLLTYLAILEIRTTGNFNIRNFFQRRILRIFPLYYLAVALGFILIIVIYPHFYNQTFHSFSVKEAFIYYLFFLPNWVIVKWDSVGPMYSLWSIGVEEQFYLIFPIIISFCIKFSRFILVISFCLLSFLLFYFSISFLWANDNLLIEFITKTLKLHFILFGSLLGAIVSIHSNKKLLVKLKNSKIQLLFGVILLAYLIFAPRTFDANHLLGAVLFSLLMVSMSLYRGKLNLENSQIKYLGQISYGLYIFHPYVSIVYRFLIEKIQSLETMIYSMPLIFYVVVTITTILVAHISYKYYETFFLKKKIRNYKISEE